MERIFLIIEDELTMRHGPARRAGREAIAWLEVGGNGEDGLQRRDRPRNRSHSTDIMMQIDGDAVCARTEPASNPA